MSVLRREIAERNYHVGSSQLRGLAAAYPARQVSGALRESEAPAIAGDLAEFRKASAPLQAVFATKGLSKVWLSSAISDPPYAIFDEKIIQETQPYGNTGLVKQKF